MVCSMRRRAGLRENTAETASFARTKDDVAHRQDWKSKAQAAREVETYIEQFDDPLKRHFPAAQMSPDVVAQARQIGRQAT